MSRLLKLSCSAIAVSMLLALPAMAGLPYWDDFESETPGAGLPASPDGYLLNWYGDFNAPDGYLVGVARDGTGVDDPIGPDGNTSIYIDNNNHGFGQTFPENDGPTNVHVGWTSSVWADDPANFVSGSIEYDLFLEPAPVGGLTYISQRIGYGGAGRGVFVSTGAADTVGWAEFRVAEDGSSNFRVNGIPGIGGSSASVAPLVGEVNHVRLDVTPGFISYTLNDELVEFTVDTGGGNMITTTVIPWFPDATGINTLTFVGDFQGAPGEPHGFVFIDNLHVVPEPAAIAILGMMGCLVASRRRR